MLSARLSGIDVVISTLAGSTFDTVQIALAKAAKLAGVKLFVPSEFGSDTLGATEGAFGQKARVQQALKELGLPYTLFFTGSFSDYVFIPFVSINTSTERMLMHMTLGRLASTWRMAR